MAGGGLHCNSGRFRLDGSREAGDNPCPLQSPCSFASASASSLWFVPTPTLSHRFTLLPAALLSFPNPEVSQGAAYVHISPNPHPFPLCLTETGKHTYTLSRVWPPVPYLDWGVSPSSCPELRPFPTRRLRASIISLDRSCGRLGRWERGGAERTLSEAGSSHSCSENTPAATWGSHLAQISQAQPSSQQQPHSNKPVYLRDTLRL